jgi:HEAT repeat protein
MHRVVPWSLAVLAAGLLPLPRLSGAEPVPPAVEEWQIKGILAALKDGHPEVGQRAARKLAEFLGGSNKQQWLGRSRQLADEATADLLKLLQDDKPIPARLAAADALVRLGAKEAAPALLKLLQDTEPSVRSAAAEALGRLRAKEAVPALRKLLQDKNASVRLRAAEALGRPGPKEAVPALLKLLQDQDRFVRRAAAEALGRLGAKEAVPALLKLLQDQDRFARHAAAEVLGRLGAKEAVPALLKLLQDDRPFVRRAAAEALGRLGAKEAVPALLKLLQDQDSLVRHEAAEALGRLGAKEEAVPALLKLLQDDRPFVRRAAAEALGRLGAKEEAVPALLKLLQDENPSVRLVAAEALGRLGAKEAVPALLKLLQDTDSSERRAAAEALVRLGAKEAVPGLLKLLQDKSSHVRDEVAEACLRLRPLSVVGALELPYEETSTLHTVRWLAHYWGGGEENAVDLCAYLGRPKSDPRDLPRREERPRSLLKTLGAAWDESRSPWLRADAASWSSWIINHHVKDWRPADEPLLQSHLQRLENDQTNKRAIAYAEGVKAILAPWKIWPPAWARTLIAVGLVNLAALLLLVLRPHLGGLENWVPFFAYVGAGTGSWFLNVVTQLHLLPWLLGGLLLGELGVVIAAGLMSPRLLRQVAKIEPLNRVAVPLALRLPWSRRRLFRDYVAEARNQLDRDRRQAKDESYLALPADLRSHAGPAAAPHPAPAPDLLRSLAGPTDQRGHVLIEAHGGRGKSALLREVVRQALDQFEKRPGTTPLPVLLTGKGDSIEKLAEDALGAALLTRELLATHLEAGDFFLVLDGITEAGLSHKALNSYVHGPYGSASPLLITGRPNKAYREVVEGAARWTVAEPRRLDEAALGAFVQHYGGQPLREPIKSACRGGPDGTYLPILVRMAMGLDAGLANAGVADIYRGYLLRLFEAQFPDEEQRFQQLQGAAAWCLQTYWRDGERKRSYEPTKLQEGLRHAGVLVPADGLDPPREVQFFHDSMQSYLTAHGLAEQEQQGYREFPRPPDDPTEKAWDRRRVLLWAAANPKFTRARSDIFQTGGTELFQMCLATFTPRDGLRRWLRDELLRWAETYDQDLPRRKIVPAIPPAIYDPIQGTRGAAKLLAKAAEASFEADEKASSVEALATLYAGIAPLVYELTEGADEPASATDEGGD